MSISGGSSPQNEPWDASLRALESDIQRLRDHSSPTDTALVRNTAINVIQMLSTLDLSQTDQLGKRITQLQGHIHILEQNCKDSRLFGSSSGTLLHRLKRMVFGSSTKKIVEVACHEIEKCMGNILKNKLKQKIGDITPRILEQIQNIDPFHIQVLLIYIEKGFLMTEQSLSELLTQIQRVPANHDLDYGTVESLISLISENLINPKNIVLCMASLSNLTLEESKALINYMERVPTIDRIRYLENFDGLKVSQFIKLIPIEERTPENTRLFIDIAIKFSAKDCQDFIDHMKNITPENRVYTLKSCVDYIKMSALTLEKQGETLLEAIKNGDTGLHLAIKEHSLEKLRQLSEKSGVMINIKDHSGLTPIGLLYSLYRGNVLFYPEGVKFMLVLLKKDPENNKRDEYGFTFYMLFKMYGIDPPPFLASQPDEIGYRLIIAALIWGIEGNVSLDKGDKLSLEGGNISVPLSQEIGSLEYLEPSISSAFSEVKHGRSAQAIAESIQAGKVTVVPTGYCEHAICLVFYKDKLFVCNRGEGCSEIPLQCFRIDPAKVDVAQVQRILDQEINTSQYRFSNFFYKTLPASLGRLGVSEDITSIFSYAQPKIQKVGNCSAASTKIAIRAALDAVSCERNGGVLLSSDAEKNRAICKRATCELRERSYIALEQELRKPQYIDIRERVLQLFAEKRAKLARENLRLTAEE